MTEHTPGPWNASSFGVVSWQKGETARWVLKPDGGGCHILMTDARLIAAAPDLLAVCENLENDDAAIPEHAWNMIQATIAKARGR